MDVVILILILLLYTCNGDMIHITVIHFKHFFTSSGFNFDFLEIAFDYLGIKILQKSIKIYISGYAWKHAP